MNAVIDIGSNSVRLLVESGAKINKKYLNSTTLAENLAITGRLSEQAMIRTANAVADFFALAKKLGATDVYVFGTEAMRAPGGEELKARIEQTIPVNVEIVSGLEEARLGFVGAGGANGSNAVIDVGGASVELISGNNGNIDYALSLPLGVVRVRDAIGDGRAAIEKYYAAEIKKYSRVSAGKLIGIGGTATSIASMALGQTVYDAEQIDGYKVTADILGELTDKVFACRDRLSAFPTLSEKRARVIGHGLIIFSLLTSYLGYDGFTVSERDNMEGYLITRGITKN